MTGLEVEIAGIKFQNPVIAASGTYGFGREFSKFIDLNMLGGIAVKALRWKKGRQQAAKGSGNAGRDINSIGLQNPGVEAFINEELPFLDKFDTIVIANIAGNTIDDYCLMAEKLSDTTVDAFELNVSCPNVKGDARFSAVPRQVLPK